MATASRRSNYEDAVNAESGLPYEAGGTVDDTKYLTRDRRRAGKQESAAGESCYLLEVYAMDQRIGMSMHLPPLGSLTAKDPGHPERQVLVRQTSDLAMLPFDHHQHDEISRRV